jgi:uncharacterized membrane protein
MKNLLLVFVFLFSALAVSASASTPSAQPTSNAVNSAFGKKVEKITYNDLKTIFEQQKGRKLSLVEKIALRVMPKKMNKVEATRAAKEFKVGGFLLGLLLGLIGVLIAYLALGNEHGMSSLYGLAVIVVIAVLAFAL